MNTAVAAPGTLKIRRLVKEYRAGQPVLNGITLDLDQGGITAIIGPSGTGKSTLIRCINRLVGAQQPLLGPRRPGTDHDFHRRGRGRSDFDDAAVTDYLRRKF